MKYVIFRRSGTNIAVLFGGVLEHSAIRELGTPISAGFVSLSQDDIGDWYVKCSGSSVSLGIASRGEEDARLIKMQLEL
jgi:hypothetical protein